MISLLLSVGLEHQILMSMSLAVAVYMYKNRIEIEYFCSH